MYREELELPDLSVLEDEMSQLVVEEDEESDYMPTSTRRGHSGLEAVNRNISMLTDGRISSIRFQLTQPLAECTKGISITQTVKRQKLSPPGLTALPLGSRKSCLILLPFRPHHQKTKVLTTR